MPKVDLHFDAQGILAAVAAAEIGLKITTNNPQRFKQIMYREAAKLNQRLHIYTYPQRPNALALLNHAPENAHVE